jgi:hypothetical protein
MKLQIGSFFSRTTLLTPVLAHVYNYTFFEIIIYRARQKVNMDLKNLTRQIPARWRVQQYSKTKPQAICVAYIDARDVMRLLDEVVGVGNWQDDYKMVGDKRFCGVGIKIPSSSTGGEWVWKWDTGTETSVESEKGEVSDSFKRACVKWGVGRFLYEIDTQYVGTNEIKKDRNNPYPIDEKGQRIWDISKYINSRFVRKS